MQSAKKNTNIPNTFKLVYKDKISNEKIEFAQMCILLARNRFPNSAYEQAKLISNKFDEKYVKSTENLKSSWNCCLILSGYGYNYCSYHHSVKLEYNDTIYHIWI